MLQPVGIVLSDDRCGHQSLRDHIVTTSLQLGLRCTQASCARGMCMSDQLTAGWLDAPLIQRAGTTSRMKGRISGIGSHMLKDFLTSIGPILFSLS